MPFHRVQDHARVDYALPATHLPSKETELVRVQDKGCQLWRPTTILTSNKGNARHSQKELGEAQLFGSCILASPLVATNMDSPALRLDLMAHQKATTKISQHWAGYLLFPLSWRFIAQLPANYSTIKIGDDTRQTQLKYR